MVSISHAVTGAYIASMMPDQPWLYLPLAFGSHFVLDYVTHFDLGIAMKMYRWNKLEIAIWESLDLLVAGVLVAVIWGQSAANFNWAIWLGALVSVTPDFMEATDYFFECPLKILKPFYKFHHDFHNSTRNVFWGLLPQVILVITLGVVVRLSW
jgi:hypothetical protein